MAQAILPMRGVIHTRNYTVKQALNYADSESCGDAANEKSSPRKCRCPRRMQ